jgi:DNA-binding FrmR family transcriptional regulator
MAHLTEDNGKLIKRVRRLKGQIEGIERMLSRGSDCYAILQNVAACRGALNSLTRELILEHIEHHISGHDEATPAIREASGEVRDIITSYLK